MHRYLAYAALSFSVLAVATIPSEAGIYGDSAPFSGSRSVAAGELVINTNITEWSGATLSWDIVDNGNFTFTYTYTFSGITKYALSHFTLDVSDDAVGEDGLIDLGAVQSASVNGNAISANKLEYGDKDGIEGAVKFDVGAEDEDDGEAPLPVVYSFVSNREPVWGDVYIKGGRGAWLKNAGFGDRDSTLASDYIARPNGKIVPEPATLVVLGVGGLLTIIRRSR